MLYTDAQMTTCVHVCLVIVCASKFHNLIWGVSARHIASCCTWNQRKGKKQEDLSGFYLNLKCFVPNLWIVHPITWLTKLLFGNSLCFSSRCEQLRITTHRFPSLVQSVKSIPSDFFFFFWSCVASDICSVSLTISIFLYFSLTHTLVQINFSYLNMACCCKPIIICWYFSWRRWFGCNDGNKYNLRVKETLIKW